MRERKPKAECRRGQADETLLLLVRLLGRQAARDFILREQRTDGSLNEPPVVDV